jgi:hypothetical protein
LNFDTPDRLAVGTGYELVVDERLATCCSALVTPAGVLLPEELLDVLELLLLELHPASATDAAMSAAHGASHPRPPLQPVLSVSLIAHASITLRSTAVA